MIGLTHGKKCQYIIYSEKTRVSEDITGKGLLFPLSLQCLHMGSGDLLVSKLIQIFLGCIVYKFYVGNFVIFWFKSWL